MLRLAIGFLALAASAPLAAAPGDPSPSGLHAVANELKADCAAGRFSGVVVVKRASQTLLELHCGDANRAEGLNLMPRSRFKIASITKPLTAIAVLRLAQQGRLRLDDPVTNYLPEAPGSWSAIRIRHLLQHTSGIADQIDKVEAAKSPDQQAAVLAVVSELRRAGHRPATTPGATFDYANFNYELAALIISRVAKAPFERAIEQLVFRPAGMKWAGVETGAAQRNSLRTAKVARPLAWGHVGTGVVDEESAPYYRGSGSMFATADDFLALDRALAGDRLLSPAMKAYLADSAIEIAPTAKQALAGLFTQLGGETVWFQWGAMDGFKPYFARVPRRGIAVVVLSNLNEVKPQIIGKQLVEAAIAASPPGR